MAMTKPQGPAAKAAEAAPTSNTTVVGRKAAPRAGLAAFWHSSIGKKWVMAVTGLLFVLFLLFHMFGNLKVFFGPDTFNEYAGWLRTFGDPVLHGDWFLWILRFILVVAIALHLTAAFQLWLRDRRARPIRYASGQRPQANLDRLTTVYGGIVVVAFLVWHLLDLTAGAIGSTHFQEGNAYQNVYNDFQHWWANLIYIVAVAVLGLHINHGFWSASQTLGLNNPRRDVAIKATGSLLAVLIAVGFMMIPIGVMTGIVK
ncbi:MAG: succinate dehydrogenase cytochrome b subunit [Actinomycetia bacterium]|nr:succinate dehydrogenase cytochrome b subunit [Actinomycetes bacterium]